MFSAESIVHLQRVPFRLTDCRDHRFIYDFTLQGGPQIQPTEKSIQLRHRKAYMGIRRRSARPLTLINMTKVMAIGGDAHRITVFRNPKL